MSDAEASQEIYDIGMRVLTHRDMRQLDRELIQFESKYSSEALSQQTISWVLYWRMKVAHYEGRVREALQYARSAGDAGHVGAKIFLVGMNIIKPTREYSVRDMAADIECLLGQKNSLSLILSSARNLMFIKEMAYWARVLPDDLVDRAVHMVSESMHEQMEWISLAGSWFDPLRVPLESLKAYRRSMIQSKELAELGINSHARNTRRVIQISPALMLVMNARAGFVDVKLVMPGVDVNSVSWATDSDDFLASMLEINEWIDASPRKVSPLDYVLLQDFKSNNSERYNDGN